MGRKVKPFVAPLPENSRERIKGVVTDPSLLDAVGIGHLFTNKTLRELKIGGGGFLLPAEEDWFRRMLERHEKASTFLPGEIRCVDPTIVEPMLIFTVPHMSWSLKPLRVPRAHIPMLKEFLKHKVDFGILEPSNAPYSNRWFTVPKKNGTLRFIQDLQPVNKVTIRNTGVGQNHRDNDNLLRTRLLATSVP